MAIARYMLLAGPCGIPAQAPFCETEMCEPFQAVRIQLPVQKFANYFGPGSATSTSQGVRLLHRYALHRASADAQRLADLQYASAALVEAQDALFQLGSAHAQRCSSVLRSPSFLLPRPSFASPEDVLHDHGALELCEDAAHLEHSFA
jgi:hypothetical protein